MKLKKVILLLLGLVAVVLVCGCATNVAKVVKPEVKVETTSLAFDGSLNPNEFTHWRMIDKRWVVFKDAPMIEVLIANPDPDAEIKQVAVLVNKHSNIIAYRYFFGEQPHVFFLNDKIKKYIQVVPPIQRI